MGKLRHPAWAAVALLALLFAGLAALAPHDDHAAGDGPCVACVAHAQVALGSDAPAVDQPSVLSTGVDTTRPGEARPGRAWLPPGRAPPSLA